MGPQYAFDCAFGGLQFVHRTLTEGRGESGGKQQRIAISKRNIQIFSKADDHFSAWLGLTGLSRHERCLVELSAATARSVCVIRR